jgi:integrase
MTTFKRGGIWWYEFVFGGARIRQSSKSRNKEVCQRAERERRRKLELGTNQLEAVSKPKLFSVAVKTFMLDKQAHWSQKTRDMHTNSQQHLEPHFGKLLLNEIRGEHISRYQRERLKTGVANRTVNIEVGLVRMVLGMKRWRNITEPDDGEIKARATMLKERTDIGRELSDDEVHRLLSACKASVSRGLYPAVLTSIHTGLRSHELRLLRWHQVDLLEGIITVGKSKTQGGEGRLVYLSALAVQTLKDWRAQFLEVQPDHAVFPREAYALKGKKGTFGGIVVPYRTFQDKPVRSFATAWRERRRRQESNAAGTTFGTAQPRA